MRFDAEIGKVAFRFDSLVFQSIAFPNSPRLPPSPAESLIVWINLEPAVSRETSRATRAGPFSTTRVFVRPLTYALGAACSWSQSMFHAGHCWGLSEEIASRAGAA